MTWPTPDRPEDTRPAGTSAEPDPLVATARPRRTGRWLVAVWSVVVLAAAAVLVVLLHGPGDPGDDRLAVGRVAAATPSPAGAELAPLPSGTAALDEPVPSETGQVETSPATVPSAAPATTVPSTTAPTTVPRTTAPAAPRTQAAPRTTAPAAPRTTPPAAPRTTAPTTTPPSSSGPSAGPGEITVRLENRTTLPLEWRMNTGSGAPQVVGTTPAGQDLTVVYRPDPETAVGVSATWTGGSCGNGDAFTLPSPGSYVLRARPFGTGGVPDCGGSDEFEVVQIG